MAVFFYTLRYGDWPMCDRVGCTWDRLPAAQSAVTLGSIVERYLKERAAKRLKPKTLTEVTRPLREHWKQLHAIPLTKVMRVDIAGQLGRIAKESGPIAANRSRAYLSTLYAWAIAEGLADANPVVGTNKAAEEISRDRVLSDEELRLVWSCAGDGDDYGAIVRLLILTGQRREEAAAMRWSELDFERTCGGSGQSAPRTDCRMTCRCRQMLSRY